MVNKKKKVIEVLLVMALFMTISLISAFEISSLYGKTSVLRISPGESKEITLTLQSSSDEADMDLKAEILKGSEIVSLVDEDTYSLSGGGGSVTSLLKVEIPEDADLGTEYVISVKFSEIEGEVAEDKTVSFTTSTAKTINVLVVEEAEEEGISTTWIILGIIAIILIIAVIWFLTKSKKAPAPVQ